MIYNTFRKKDYALFYDFVLLCSGYADNKKIQTSFHSFKNKIPFEKKPCSSTVLSTLHPRMLFGKVK